MSGEGRASGRRKTGRDWFVDEDYEERIRELLGGEVVDLVRSVDPEELGKRNPLEEEKFERVLALAEELGRLVVEELVEVSDEALPGSSVAEKAGAFLDVFGSLVKRLSDRHLFDFAVKLNARIPWLGAHEFADPGGPYEFTLTCDYTREANWRDMVAAYPRGAYEAAARNRSLLDTYDVAVIAYALYLEGEEEFAEKLMPLDEAEEKWFKLKNMLGSVCERRNLPGRRAGSNA